MCIFSSDLVVKSTKILAADIGDSRRLLAYQNSVVTSTKNVMMLPIPCDEDGVIFHDTSAYASFLEDIAMKIVRKEMEGCRGVETPVGFSRVGQYQYKLVPADAVEYELAELNQPIPRWLGSMIDKYQNWSWLLCIIDANAEMKNQPLMIEFRSIIPEMYFPMMDVHGDDDVAPLVQRDHVLISGHNKIKNPIDLAANYPEFPYRDLLFTGESLKGRMLNGDVLVTLSDDPENWKAKWV